LAPRDSKRIWIGIELVVLDDRLEHPVGGEQLAVAVADVALDLFLATLEQAGLDALLVEQHRVALEHLRPHRRERDGKGCADDREQQQ
jgi:hypothetical protein